MSRQRYVRIWLRAKVALAITAAPLVCITSSNPQVVINEVMANVKGSESCYGGFNEWIELYNCSPHAADLSGWTISDGDATDDIIAWPSSLGSPGPGVVLETCVVPGGGCCLILDRDYASAPDSEGYKPYLFPAGTVILTVGNGSIGNGLSTTDPIILSGSNGETADTYGTPWDEYDSIPFDPGDGVSAEKVFPEIGDGMPNWEPSAGASGCTPGRQNSVTPYTGIGLSWEDIRMFPEEPSPGAHVELEATVHNRSREWANGIKVSFFIDSNWDSDSDADEVLEVLYSGSIPPLNGVVIAASDWESVPNGYHRIGVLVMDSVSAFRTFKVGRELGHVIINEVMFEPDQSGEWIEICNRSDHELNLRQWILSDGDRSCIVARRDNVLEARAFALICSDTLALSMTYSFPDCILLEPEGFPSLNNQGDSVLLSDASGLLSDVLGYQGSWGGGRGVSLERISPEIASDDRTNWSGCVDSRGATPGYENSLHTEVCYQKARISLSPNPFSPDGDGVDDRTVISYALPFGVARLRILVYDKAGRIVRKVLSGGEVAGRGALLWDGRDDHGVSLPIGIYLVYAEAHDLFSGSKVCSRATVVLAKRLN